jgi:hypothetical protein
MSDPQRPEREAIERMQKRLTEWADEARRLTPIDPPDPLRPNAIRPFYLELERCLRDCVALLAALPPTPTPGWQDISTAPKDTAVLTFRGAGLMSVAERMDHPADFGKKKQRETWCCTDGCELLNVTHWQPLPPAPTGERE